RLVGIEHGDWIQWTSDRYGPSNRTGAVGDEEGGHILNEEGGLVLADPTIPIIFRVETDSQDERWWNSITLREITPECFDWNAAIDELVDQSEATGSTPPDYSDAPGADAWALAADTLIGDGGSVVALVFTGASDDDYAEAIIFEFVATDIAPDPDDDSLWTIGTTAAP